MIRLGSGITGKQLSKKLGIKIQKPKKQSEADYNTKEWKNLRQLVLKRDKNRCTKCGSKTILHCHHLYYVAGRLRYEYPITALKILCKKCHVNFHKNKPGYKMVISEKKALKIESRKIKNKPAINTGVNYSRLNKELNDRFKFLIAGE